MVTRGEPVSPFKVLGVSPTASDGEISAAYHRRARQLHPDAHPDASAAQRASYEAEMTRVNVAYEAIKTAARRNEWRRSQPPRMHRDEPTAPVGRCDMCGATPAMPFRYPSGRTSPTNIRLCPRCAEAVTRPLPVNTRVLGRYVAIGLSVAALVVAAVVLLARNVDIASSVAPNPDSFQVPFPSHTIPNSVATTTVDPWTMYDCVTARPQRDPVDCAQPHQGVITARVNTGNLCPAGTDHYRQIPSTKQIACIDES
jgi:DnaJ domain